MIDIPTSDLPPAPPRWRRLLPSPIRRLIWHDNATNYDAFLSYAWKADRETAPVIQSLMQRFLCPWYRIRAKRIFRDLSCLPAGRNLEDEICERIDRSKHLIVLASPDALDSKGMEWEARHWFSCERDGEVIVIVSSGTFNDWSEIREKAVPPSISANLTVTPLWIDLSRRRGEILRSADNPRVRNELIEELAQVILRLYPGRDWGELRGEEYFQRRRALRLVFITLLGFVFLASWAGWEAMQARQQRNEALRQRDEAIRQQHVAQNALARSYMQDGMDRLDYEDRPIESGEALAYFARAVRIDPNSQAALSAVTDRSLRAGWLMPMAVLRHQDIVMSAAFSPDGRRVVTASADKTAHVWDILLDCCASQQEADRLASLSETLSGLAVSETGTLYPVEYDRREKLAKLTYSAKPNAPRLSLDWLIRDLAGRFQIIGQ